MKPYGWFDDPGQREPTSDLQLPVSCPLCGKQITGPDTCRTINLAPLETYAPRSYFYFVHRECHDGEPDRADEIILAAIKANGD